MILCPLCTRRGSGEKSLLISWPMLPKPVRPHVGRWEGPRPTPGWPESPRGPQSSLKLIAYSFVFLPHFNSSTMPSALCVEGRKEGQLPGRLTFFSAGRARLPCRPFAYHRVPMMFRVHPSRFPTSSSQLPRRRLFLNTRREEFILVLEGKTGNGLFWLRKQGL